MFKIQVTLQNTGTKPIYHVRLVLGYNHTLYKARLSFSRVRTSPAGVATSPRLARWSHGCRLSWESHMRARQVDTPCISVPVLIPGFQCPPRPTLARMA